MAKGVNKVILVGNVGQDPECRAMPNGSMVVNATVATSETWKDKQTGQKQERTEWHNVVFFGRTAEVVRDFLKKGSKVYIEGSLKTRSWEKDGKKHFKTEIVANEMQMLDSKGQGGNNMAPQAQGYQQPQQGQYNARQPQQPPPQYNQEPAFEDDIPF